MSWEFIVGPDGNYSVDSAGTKIIYNEATGAYGLYDDSAPDADGNGQYYDENYEQFYPADEPEVSLSPDDVSGEAVGEVVFNLFTDYPQVGAYLEQQAADDRQAELDARPAPQTWDEGLDQMAEEGIIGKKKEDN